MLSHVLPGSALARSATAAATAALLAMGVTGCEKNDAPKAAPKPVQRASPQVKKLEDNIRSGIAARYAADVTEVVCPASLGVKVGAEIKCQVRVASSELPLEISVAWTSDAGAFQWRDRGVIRLDKLKALVAQKLEADKRPGAAQCDGTIRVSQPGSEFACAIEYADGTMGAVSVRVRTWQGDVDLQFR